MSYEEKHPKHYHYPLKQAKKILNAGMLPIKLMLLLLIDKNLWT